MLASLASLSYLSKNTTTEPTPPPTITSITGTATTLTVNFNRSSSENITGYKYSIDNGVTFVSTSTTTSPITINDLAPSSSNVTYYVKIIEVVNGIDSLPSSAANGVKNGTSWTQFGTPFGSSNVNSTYLRAMKIGSDGTIYVGGAFGIFYNTIGGNTWSNLGSLNSATCLAIAIDSSNNIYVGGTFTTIGGVAYDRIAKITKNNNGSYTVSSLGNISFFPSNSVVRAIACDASGNVFVGGDFTAITINNVYTDNFNYIAKYNPTTSTWSRLAYGLSSTCLAIAIDSSNNVYAGGSFITAYNGIATNGNLTNSVTVNYIAKINPNVSTPIWSSLNKGISGGVLAISIDSLNNLYVGGQFQYASNSGTNDTSANRIVKWNGSLWSALGGGTSGDVHAIQIMSNNAIYVGGLFSTATSITVNNIALYNINENKWYSVSGGLNARVYDIATNSGKTVLIAGGSFSIILGTTTTYRIGTLSL